MKKIHLTKTDWSITATYTYRQDGVCVAVQLPEDIPADRITGFYKIATIPFESVLTLPMNDRSLKIEEEIDLTFDNAWKKYNYKQGKTKAQEAWARLKDDDKIKALKYMPAYDRSLHGTGIAKLYFERYCKYKKWEDFV